LGATDPAAAWDVYREIHKAMRYALFGVTSMAGRTDAADDAGRGALLEEWRDVAFVLEGHHHHEDQFCDPLIARHAPGLRDELEAEHRLADAGIARLRRAAAVLAASGPGAERWPLLRSFHLDLADFTAAYLTHLRYEEDRVMPALSAAMTDEELAEVTTAIRMSVPPPDMCTFIRYMAPAMDHSERVDMLTGMRAAPPEIFEMFRDAIERCLEADDYRAVAVACGFA